MARPVIIAARGVNSIILGKGGHARAFSETFGGRCVLFYLDHDEIPHQNDIVYIGVGDIPTRKRLFKKYRSQIPNGGVQLMDNTHVGPNVRLGYNILVNTGAQIDHDCVIGDHCVISPGAILCGGVKLGEACFIGAGAIIVENVELAPETFVPAGTLVVGPDDFRRPQRVV